MPDWDDRIEDDRMRQDLYLAVEILREELGAGKIERKDRRTVRRLVKRYGGER